MGGERNPPLAQQGQMLCHHRQNALTLTAGAGRVTCSRQRGGQRGPAWLAETDAEDAVSVEVQPWASLGSVLGKGAATGEATARSPSVGILPWAMEIKIIRREYSRGQWRTNSNGWSMIVGRSLQQ